MKARRFAIGLLTFVLFLINSLSITSISSAVPAVDPVKSTVIANPTTVAADGVSFTRITVNAVGVNGKPVNITSAILNANPSTGLLYAWSASSNPPPPTPGQAVFIVSSTVTQQVTFTAVINGVTLQQTAVVTFGPSLGLQQ